MKSHWLVGAWLVFAACGGKVDGGSAVTSSDDNNDSGGARSGASAPNSDASASAADLQTKAASITSLYFHPVATSAEPKVHDVTLDDVSYAQNVFTWFLGGPARGEIVPCEGYVRNGYYDVTFYAGSSIVAHLEVDPDATCGAVALDDGESLALGDTAKIATDLGFATADIFPY